MKTNDKAEESRDRLTAAEKFQLLTEKNREKIMRQIAILEARQASRR